MNRADEWADYLDPAEADPELPPDHRDALDQFAAALSSEAVWGEPPASLRARVLDLAMREGPAGTEPVPAPRFPDGTVGYPADRTAPGPPGRAPRRVRPAWWMAVAGVAAAAVLVVALALPRPETTTFAMSGTSQAPSAAASARLEPRSAGLAITLEITGLAAAPDGTYYAAWLRGPDGVVPVGTFHWRKGGIPIELWSGVLTDRYPELFVTLQREGAPPTPSTDVVLTGTVPAG